MQQLVNHDYMIHADIIYKQLQCAICLNSLNNPALTKCGHSFCYKCIDEVVNRYHKCPLCNRELAAQDMFLNQHLSQLILILEEEREQKLNRQVQETFGKATLPQFDIISQVYFILIQLFKDAIKRMHQIYESKYLESAQQYQDQIANILKDPPQDQDKAISELTNQFEQLREYYVSKVKENLSRLDQNISIDIFTRISVKEVEFALPLNPRTRISDLNGIITNHFDKLTNPLVQKDNLTVSINLKVFPLTSDLPLLSIGLVQGSLLAIQGDIKFKNEIPPECITHNFVQNKIVNYFSCNTCKIHWVCEQCKNFCHQNHETLVYKSNLPATWACCYCFSKGFCKATNKNSKVMI